MKLPVLKLGTIAVRTIAKPIANRLKKDAGLHPKFREFIINIAQANHHLTTRLQRSIYGPALDVVIRPLNEEKAVEAAAEILGELFVFSVAGLAIIYEVQRSARAEARKEAKHKQEMEKKNENLSKEIDSLKKKLDEIALLKFKLDEVQRLASQRNCFNLFRYWQHAQTTKSA